MITNILLTKGYEKGYLPKVDSAMIQPTFATANLAIRKEALDEIGPFDINCKTGEDVDLCIRLAKTKWEIFFEPRAIIKHKHRTTLIGLLKQWYGYGKYHPYVFKKHTPKCIQIYYPSSKSIDWFSVRFLTIFGLPFPLYILVFVTEFHLFNIFSISIIFSIIMKLHWLLMVSLIGWLYFGKKYFFSNFSFRKIKRWIIYSIVRYIVNWAYVIGAFLGGLKIGVIYIEASNRAQIPLD